ncbi:ribonuclease BN [Catenulispora acidiphila DSM 44928]|uniref:Ribonuclease BN n=1 Tax=Catenulispora acidiphila (strain DSM 44928 / JCM 14897 / NBRC 102108 / NRRL B-24433 / ID139908) TaxID=479433 RepID=C7Q6R9_CATAD|nr:YihY/virulence factor BrkB family protein [Catenulispora acidiphila]ACU74104.1 ribonuclease BN [Catenulispora acidiphila DSM 44928]
MRRKTESRLERRLSGAKPAASLEETSKTAAKAAVEQEPDKVDRLPQLSVRNWLSVLKRSAVAAHTDELVDRAAALTYYGFLAVFPTLLLAISVLGLLGTSTVNTVLDNVQKLAPGSVHDVLRTAITQVRASGGTGGTLAIAGVLGALWSASGYVGAFIRASNVVYGVRENRPMWKTTPLRIGLTMLMMVTSMVSIVIVVFTGPLADRTSQILGLGHTAFTIWSIVKWPVLVFLVAAMIVLLFWAAPKTHGVRRFRWISPGSLLAVVLWLVLSTGFATYIANFASYNKTYGTVAGVIVFLLWLWLSNLAILLGLEFDVELTAEHATLAAARA